MKLGQIVVARESFGRLSMLRMPPHTAYRLLKYLKLVNIESQVIEERRVLLLRNASGIKDGAVELTPGTPEYDQFLGEYAAVLEMESDLKPLDMRLDDLLTALSAEQGNVLSAADFGSLEPFFEADGI